MADVVIIFSHKDLGEAAAIRAVLEADGITVLGPPVGREPWPNDWQVREACLMARAVVVIWSPRSVGDQRVLDMLVGVLGNSVPLVTLTTRDLDIATLRVPLSARFTAGIDDPRRVRQIVIEALGDSGWSVGAMDNEAAGFEASEPRPVASVPQPMAAPDYSTATASASAPVASPSPAAAPPPAPAPVPAPASAPVSAPASGGRADDLEIPEFLRPSPSPVPEAAAGIAVPPGLSMVGMGLQRGAIASHGTLREQAIASAPGAAMPPPAPTLARKRAEAAREASAPPMAAPRGSSRGLAVAAGTLVAVGAVAIAYALGAKFFGELADKLLAVIGMSKGALPPGAAVAPPQEAQVDLVDCSVFAPPKASPKARFMVQVFLHLVEQAERVAFMATTMDDGARLRGVQTLQVPIVRGTRVRAVLEGNGLLVDEPVLELIWRGEPNVAAFACEMAAAAGQADVHPVVRLYVGDEPVGRVLFKVSVVAETAVPSTPEPELTGTSARRYSQAFLSYASEDRAEVLKRAQALAVARIGFFQDLLSLSPGERYERKIHEKIGEADLFMLFWSRHAMASEWVAREIAYARECQRRHPQSLPDIVPVVLDDPRDAPPPQVVGDHHFNDTIAALISYEQARRSGSAWSWRGLFRRGRP